MRTDNLHLAELPHATTAAAPMPVDVDAVVPCRGYWAGKDVHHTPHTPCANPARWAGLSDHDDAKTTTRCHEHRIRMDIAIREGTMFCLTCKGRIRAMTWWEL